MLDICISGAKVYDGTGNPWYWGDIGVKEGRIVAIGIVRQRAREIIDGTDLVVCPGFVDVHTHADGIIGNSTADNVIRQGVTTVVSGNCGGSGFPIKDMLDRVKAAAPAINYATLVGHGTIRCRVMGMASRKPTLKELTHVKEYAYCDRVSRQEHKSYNLIDGKLSQEEIVSVDMDSSPPPSHLLSQHIWKRLPSFEDPDAKSVCEPGIGAVGDGKADDTDALQKAIDRYTKVFLPKGTYKISRTLILRKNTQLFGIAKAHTSIVTSEDWLPTEETPMLMTVDDANATTYLANMNIGFNTRDTKHDFFNLVT